MPTAGGSITATVDAGVVVDSYGITNLRTSDSTSFTLLPPTVTSSLTATGSTGTPFSYAIRGAYLVTSYNATGLPDGLTVDTATGAITGTPTRAGATNATISVTNPTGTTAETMAITVSGSGGAVPPTDGGGGVAPVHEDGGDGAGGCGAGSAVALLLFFCLFALRPHRRQDP